MTLNTSVYVIGGVDVHAAFHKSRELLETPPDIRVIDEPSSWNDGQWDLRHPGGVGLDAWLWCHYKPDGPLRTPEDVARAEAEDDYDGPACFFDLSFDTAYGYSDSQGRDCGGLHASLVARLGEWLDEHGARWGWQNEFTGEIHWGEDKYERLWDLFSGSDEAVAWFEGVVKPLIARHVAGGR